MQPAGARMTFHLKFKRSSYGRHFETKLGAAAYFPPTPKNSLGSKMSGQSNPFPHKFASTKSTKSMGNL